MMDDFLKNIAEADKVLIGIGTAFEEKYSKLYSEEFLKFESEEPLLAGYEKIKYIEENLNKDCFNAYQKLFSYVKDKDYFLITICKDDVVYKVGFDEEKIVAPCGTFRFLQCVDNCKKELLPVSEKMISDKQEIFCPHCHKKACFNQIGEWEYNEDGYLPQWHVYNKWLQSTINKKLCIIELGVGMQYPTVIRWPFEKMFMFNNKAVMYRVHETLNQFPAEIEKEGYSVAKNPIDFLLQNE